MERILEMNNLRTHLARVPFGKVFSHFPIERRFKCIFISQCAAFNEKRMGKYAGCAIRAKVSTNSAISTV